MPTYLHINSEPHGSRETPRGRYELLHMDYELSREIDRKGEIVSELQGGKVQVVIAGPGDDTLFRWLCGSPALESGYVSEVTEGKSVSRVLDFTQAKITNYKVQYDSFSKQGLTTALTFEAKELATDNDLYYERKK